MKKIFTLVLSASLLTSCSIKTEAFDLYNRIADFFKENTAVVSELFTEVDEQENEDSDVAIDVVENDNNTVNVNITDKNEQVLDVDMDKETYEKYDELIENAKAYIAENNVDVSRLSTDKIYAMKHAMNFSNKYNVDLNSLSQEEISKLQELFNSY